MNTPNPRAAVSASTPAEHWCARKLGPPSYTWQVDDGNGPIAVVTTPQPPFATKGDPARSERRARLIAAAPDLLATLQTLAELNPPCMSRAAEDGFSIHTAEESYRIVLSRIINEARELARAAIARAQTP